MFIKGKDLGQALYCDLIAVHYNRPEEVKAAKKAGFAADLRSAIYDGEYTYIDHGDPLSDAVEKVKGDAIVAMYVLENRHRMHYTCPDLWGEKTGSLVVECNGDRQWLRTASLLREVTGMHLVSRYGEPPNLSSLETEVVK